MASKTRDTLPQMNMRLLNKKLESYESSIKFGQRHGILPSAVTCCCGSYIDKYRVEERCDGRRSAYFRCNKRSCRTKINLRKSSIFENSKLKIHQVFLLMYTFTQFLTYNNVINECSELPAEDDEPTMSSLNKRLGRSTVARYFTHFRAWICQWSLDHQSTNQIGGPGMTVEIDESKFGKRKYHR